MRVLFFIVIGVLNLPAKSQFIDAMRLQLGPKMEFYQSEQQLVTITPHLDAGASVSAIHQFTEHISAHVGLVKRDFSCKYSIEILDPVTMERERYFKKNILPSFSSYQLYLMPSYTYFVTSRLAAYGGLGIQIYLQQKMRNPGILNSVDYLYDEDDQAISSLSLTTYNKQLGAGNFFIRSELGVLYAISDMIQLDASLTHSWSTLEHYSFNAVFTNSVGTQAEDRIYTKGHGLALNVGARFVFN